MRRVDARWLVIPDRTFPLDLGPLFDRTAPFEMEIGFGRGEFLVHRAKANPDINYIGIESAWGSIQRTLRRVAREGVTNIRVIFANAAWAIQRLFPKNVFRHIWSLFPDPWPKSRHEHHRLGHPDFFVHIARILEPGGRFTLATDDTIYASWLEQQWPARFFSVTMEHYSNSPRFGTKYETRWLLMGKEIQVFHWRKIRHPDLKEPEPWAMEIYKFSHSFEPSRVVGNGADHEGEVTVAFKGFYWDAVKRVGFFRVVIKEGALIQKVFLELKDGPRGWTLSPSNMCTFLPTYGLRKALDFAYARVVAAGPGNRESFSDAESRS